MDLILVENMIKNNKINDAEKAIKKIGQNRYKEAIPFLIEQIENTDNNSLRNTIALALSDIGDHRAVIPLINLIKNPKTEGNRGTLLYALEPFDYSEHIEMLISLLYEDNFEVSREAFALIKKTINNFPKETRKKFAKTLKNDIEELKGKIDFFNEAIEMMYSH